MQQQLTKLQGAWAGIPRRAQLAIASVALVALLVMFLVVRAATATDWVAATDQLPSDRLGEAQTILEEAGISHQLSASRTAIEVAAKDEPKAKDALMTAGIAAKGGRTGCSAQSEKGSGIMAQTSAQHALMLETCRENDAANTIENIEGISKATVDVTMPDKSLFSSEEQPAKASVTIDTDGLGIGAKAIKGIQSTVAGGFEGLRAQDVVVVDETGSILGGDDSTDAESSRMEKLQAEAALNKKIENDLTTTFEKIVGAGNVVITSNVVLDMDKIKREVLENKAAGEDGQPLVEIEDTAKELLSGAGATGVQGVAGVGTNIGVDPNNRTVTPDVDTDGDGDPDYVSDEARVTYANNKVAEIIDVAPGAVLASRLGVVVDDDVDPAAANAVKNAMQAWMGGNAADSFSFDQVPIAAAQPLANPPSATRAAIAGYVKWALLGIGLIGLAFVLRRSLTQRTAELLAPADDLLLLEGGDFTPIPIAELEAALAAGQPSAERRSRLEMQRKVESIADSKPQDVANELRRWMHSEETNPYAPTHRKAG